MFLDIHAHLYKYPYPYGYDEQRDSFRLIFPNEEELIEIHDELEIDRAVLLPLVSSEVYLPQSVGELIDICDASDGRFIPFCNIDPRVMENASDAPLGILLEFFKRQGCRGVGEVLPNMEFSDPKLQNLFHHCEHIGMPLLFDLSGCRGYNYGLYDDRGLPQLRKCLERFPDLIFIGHGPAFWAELGTLRKEGDRTGYPDYPIDEEGAVPALLRDHPNLWLDLSAVSGGNAMRRDPAYAVQFLREFSDRTMFGTDICFAGEYDFVLTNFLKQLKQDGSLSAQQFEAIAHGNAERLLGIE